MNSPQMHEISDKKTYLSEDIIKNVRGLLF